MQKIEASPFFRLLLALSSAALLIASFPSFSQPWCAWIALVPWLRLLPGLSGRRAFGWSWLIGVLFFLGSMWWLVHLARFGGPAALAGWVALSAYLALYFGVFGWLVSRPARQGRRSHVSSLISQVWPLVYVPSVWVALEFARSRLLSGFGWNLLAYSQTPWLPVIQVADLTGGWGVSWLIVAVNVAAARAAAPRAGAERRLARVMPLAVAGGLAAAAVGYGLWRLPQVRRPVAARVTVVQGNIPQEEKWDEAQRESILSRYESLTRDAARSHPQLIVWPETATPGYLGLDESVTQRMSALARSVGIPLLVGAPMGELETLQWRMTNSAVLIDAAGALQQRYDKLHLVPFGEFVPGERWLPWLRHVLPPIGEFSPGSEYTVFHLGSRLEARGSRQEQVSLQPPASSLHPTFSVLICFEDIFPELARRFVRQGARLLLVITNDAWFGPTAAAYQHAQASTFRAVELRVPVARAANTGWSGCIESSGRWASQVHDASDRELFVPGTVTCELHEGQARSLYLQLGDWFAWGCVIVATGWLMGWYNQASTMRST